MFKKLFKIFKENAVAYAAVFISLLALFVSITQTRILSQEKHASVWPCLQIGESWLGDSFLLSVDNVGVGPAIIQSVEYRYPDTTFTVIHDFISHVVRQEQIRSGKIAYTNIEYMGCVIPQGESRNLIDVKEDTIPARAIRKHRDSLEVIINYCSIYGKCWKVKEYSTQKTKLKSEFKNLIY